VLLVLFISDGEIKETVCQLAPLHQRSPQLRYKQGWNKVNNRRLHRKVRGLADRRGHGMVETLPVPALVISAVTPRTGGKRTKRQGRYSLPSSQNLCVSYIVPNNTRANVIAACTSEELVGVLAHTRFSGNTPH